MELREEAGVEPGTTQKRGESSTPGRFSVHSLIYLVGLIVIVLAVLSLFGAA